MTKKRVLISFILLSLFVGGYFLHQEYQKRSWSDKAEQGTFVIAFRGGIGADEVEYLKLSDEIFNAISNSTTKNEEIDIREKKWGNPTWHRLQFPSSADIDLGDVSKICKAIEKEKKGQANFVDLEIFVIDDKGNKY